MENNTTNKATWKQTDKTLSVRDVFALCLGNWKWMLVSFAICMLLAAYYCIKTVPTYSRSASVLIKEDRKSGTVQGDVSQAFSNMGMGITKVNVFNEIVSFKSPDLMLQVAKNLNLDVDYKLKGLRYFHTIYGTELPVRVSFLDFDKSRFSGMKLTVNTDSTTVTLHDFTRGGDEIDADALTVAYGDTVSTPLGRLVVKRSEYAGTAIVDRPIYVTRTSPQAAAGACKGRLSVELSDKNTTIIDLRYNDVNIQRAEDVLQMVINCYNENWIKDKNQITIATNEFIAERLNVIEQELGSVDKTITSYRSTHRLPDAGAVAQMDMQISAEASKHLMELNNQLSIARFLQSDIRGASSGTLLPANVGLDDINSQNAIAKYNEMMLQRNRIVESSSEENLLVLDLDQQLASLKSSILSSLDNYIRSVNIQIQSAQRARSSSEARVSDVPLQAGQLLSDERQQKVKEALYLFLLQKREENELSQAFTAYNTRVVSTPNGSNGPVAPNRAKVFLIAFFLSIAIPFVYFFFKETLNTTVRGRKDLENLSAPFLGELPATERRKGLQRLRRKKISDKAKDRKIVVKPHSRNMVNEAFRVVRTNLEFLRGKGSDKKVFMVTSFNVGAGKTFVSSNLATALAISGRRTIIVDLDLRKRSLSALAEQPKKGVVDYLAGETDKWEDLVVHGFGGNSLDLLPSGKMPPNPSELLGEDRLAELLGILRQHYDYIFLDCPPIEIVTDSDVIAPNADITIFVVRVGLFDRAMLPEIERYYQEKRYNNMAILINGSETTGRYGYKYGYKYGYRYGGYGYGKYGSSYGSSYGVYEKS